LKKFSFKLDKLLSYKDQLLESEMLKLAALNDSLRRVNARMDALAEDRLRCGRELREKQAAGAVTPAACQLHSRYDGFLKDEIASCRREAEALAVRIEAQIEVIRGLRLETKTLELMKDSRLAAWRKEEIKESEHQIDEFVNTARAMRTEGFALG
jgi:flagellar export protein FliJ